VKGKGRKTVKRNEEKEKKKEKIVHHHRINKMNKNKTHVHSQR